MHNSRFLEYLAFGNVTVLEVEAFGGELSMEYGAAETLALGVFHQERENTAPDSFAPPFAQYRHPANLHVTVVHHHSATADRSRSVQCERMKRIRVVLIHLDFFGHMLFFDKDQAPNRPRLIHLRPFRNLNYFDLRAHLFAPKAHVEETPKALPNVSSADRRGGQTRLIALERIMILCDSR